MTATPTPTPPRNSPTKTATVDYIDYELSKTTDYTGVQSLRAMVKKQMKRSIFGFDNTHFLATIKWLSDTKRIEKIGAGGHARYRYIPTIDECEPKEMPPLAIPDSLVQKRPEKEPVPFGSGRPIAHDWQGQGRSVRPEGKSYWVHPGAVRAGCTDALDCPSLLNGERRARTGVYIGQGPKSCQLTYQLTGAKKEK